MSAVTGTGPVVNPSEPAPSDDAPAGNSSAHRFSAVGEPFDDRWIVRGLDVDAHG